MIGQRTAFIFVHIPKNGGTSVTRALKPYALGPGQRLVQSAARRIKRDKSVDHYGLYPGGGHATASRIRDEIGGGRYDAAFSFAFVRNPWDRLLSIYSYAKGDARRANNALALDSDFETFLLNFVPPNPLIQWEYVSNSDGEQIVDEIGRFETFSQDFSAICARLGIKSDLPHRNASTRPKYRDAYSDAAREIVAEKCAEDIARFGYTF